MKQLRLVVEAEDFDAALVFYRDVLGLTEQVAFEGEGEARVAILDAGGATLELSNPAQVRMIDQVEADGTPSARIRVAFEVDDATRMTDELVNGGAGLIAEPRETPWRSLNSRLQAPAGLQVTLFQELETLEERSARQGFTRPIAREASRFSRIVTEPDPYEPFNLSQGIRHGDLLFISGQAGTDDDGQIVGVDDFETQAVQAFANLDRVLRAGGSSLSDVVKVTIFLTDIASNFPAIVELRKRFFTAPYPADTIVEVAALYTPDAAIEIEAIAVATAK